MNNQYLTSHRKRMLREEFIKYLEQSDDNLIKIDKSLLTMLVFDEDGEIAVPDEYLFKIDFSNISFDNKIILGHNFSNTTGVTINPLNVYDRDCRYTNFKDVTLTASLFNCKIKGSSFAGSTGAVIYPELVWHRDCRYVNFKDACILGTFKHCNMKGSSVVGIINTPTSSKEVLSSKTPKNITNIEISNIYDYNEIKNAFTRIKK